MRRLMMYDRLGNSIGELAENDVFAAIQREEINGEHSLEITTTKVIEKGTRIICQDAIGKWREWAVSGIDAEHASGNRAIGTYYCVWSLQEDLMGVTVSVMPGVQSPVNAGTALTSLLSTSARWVVGTVDNTALGGASMYDRSAWAALTTLVENWGGEIDAAITTGRSGVTGRAVDYYLKQGNQTAKRRFDFGADLRGITRTVADEPLYCRISPRGAGEQTDAGGYGRKITIESVNGGKDYLVYTPMVEIARLSDGHGGYEYPTLIVENQSCKTPEDLLEWAQGALEKYCTPDITYDIDVLQTGVAGVDFSGVALGDAVQVVDRKFNDLRIEGRISSITTDLLNEHDLSITIGSINDGIAARFANVNAALESVDNSLVTMSTSTYITDLLSRINAEINATGGYTYITEGQGIRTYDTAVSNPLIGSEASSVVEIKGGTIRIANSRTSGGEWDWKTVFTSGHITSNLITAANLVTGSIGNPSQGNYWDLDNNQLRLAPTTILDDTTVQNVLNAVDSTIINVDVQYAQNQSTSTAPSSGWSTTAPEWREGYYIWQRTATTTPSGVTYSNSVCISGKNGEDGKSVTILGSYDTLAELQAAHPTGSVGDGYIVGDDLYVWNGSAWTNVGAIRGPQGTPGVNGIGISSTDISYGTSSSASTQPSNWSSTAPTSITKGLWLWTRTVYTYTDSTTKTVYSKSYVGTDGTNGTNGTNGTSVTVSSIQYGISSSASATPSSWSNTVPTSITKGSWLWVKTTYSDNSTATTKSYIGTDGEDGTSVYVQSASKSQGTTTVVIAGTDGTTHTLVIDDGADGANGQPGAPGADGTPSYVHIAWANSADGTSGFSTTVSANKSYIGVYTDSNQSDSTSPSSYSWSLIKGADGVSSAAVILYKRGTSAPSKPNGNVTYTFATGAVSGSLNGWTTSIPSGDNPCWAIAASASSSGTTDTIASSEWSSQVKMLENGTDGIDGLDGLNQATINLYRRSVTSPALPTSAVTYTFATGALSSVPSGWSRNIPTANGNPCWVTSAVAISSEATDSIAASEWVTPTKMVEDGIDGIGISSIVEQYYLSTSITNQTGGEWSTEQPAWEEGKYIWTRSEITWDDGVITYTTPVLAKAINGANEAANYELGNTNLVRNGNFGTGDTSYWTRYTTNTTWAVSSDSTFETYLSVTQNSGGMYNGVYPDQTTSFTHVANETYSLTFYAKASAANTLTVCVGTSTTNVNCYFKNVEIGTSWQRFESTITPNLAGVLRFFLVSAGTLDLANVMLVKGEKPLDFMQDPRDLYGTMTTAAETAAMVRAYGAGVLVCRQGNTIGALVNADGSFDVVKVTWANKVPTASTVYASYAAATTRIGDPTATHVDFSIDGLAVFGKNPVNLQQIIEIGHIGYTGSTVPYFTFGSRASESAVGKFSLSHGSGNTASGDNSFASGNGAKATGVDSVAFGAGISSGHKTVAFGSNTEAIGTYSIACGSNTIARAQSSLAGGTSSETTGVYSIAFGKGVKSYCYYEAVFGAYNVVSPNSYTNILVVGNGEDASHRSNALTLSGTGNLTISGRLTENSDRRLKEHISYLGEDAAEFCRNLKPALYIKDGERKLGFYAQDINEADIWNTSTVKAQHTDESKDYDPLTLEYSAIIAPITAYAQSLEKRIEQLEKKLGVM